MKELILSHLSLENPWRNLVLYEDTVTSTNDILKQMAQEGAPHGTVLVADCQTGGKGRLGRSFLSPSGMGIYMSVLIRPQCLPAQLMHLTCAAAWAVCNAIERTAGIRPGIKWTNDIVFNGKKLCGILTELGFGEKNCVDYAIIGVGLNCNQLPDDFAPEIRQMAGSLRMVSGMKADRALMAASLVESFAQMARMLLDDKDAIMACYRRDCITIGRDVRVLHGDTSRQGTAVGLDCDGALIVQFPEGTETIQFGEVSVRGLYQYT